MIFRRRLLVVIATIAVSISACNTRRPARFLIPDGFKGWVKIDFQTPNNKPLPVEDGRWLFNLDSAGHLQTSSPLDGGIAADDFYYVSSGRRTPLRQTESCQGGSIWGLAIGSDSNSNRADREWFFVGSEAEYRQKIDPGGRIYIPCLAN
jgi:hypothetical protein